MGALLQPLETMSSSNVTNTLRPWRTLVSMENLATASSTVCKPPASSAPCVQMWGTGAASGPTVAVHPQSAARADARSPCSAPQHQDTFDFCLVYFLQQFQAFLEAISVASSLRHTARQLLTSVCVSLSSELLMVPVDQDIKDTQPEVTFSILYICFLRKDTLRAVHTEPNLSVQWPEKGDNPFVISCFFR